MLPSVTPVSPENKSAQILRGRTRLPEPGLKFFCHSEQQPDQELLGKGCSPSAVGISRNALGSNRAEGQGF